MKSLCQLIFASVVLLAVFSCSKDDGDSVNPGGTASFLGSFISSAHPTSGTATVNKDQTLLSLAQFKTDSGPALNIYLASDINNVEGDYIDLGVIKGVNGNYVYDLPTSTDFADYKYVVVWCVAFHVNFGYAELEKQ